MTFNNKVFTCACTTLLAVFAVAGDQLLVKPNGRSVAQIQKAVDGLGRVSGRSKGDVVVRLAKGINPRKAQAHIAKKGLIVSVPETAWQPGTKAPEIKEESQDTDFNDAREWQMQVRRDKNGNIDPDALAKARELRDGMKAATFQGPKGEALRPQAPWQWLGPFNLTPPSNRIYFGPGRISGRVNAAAFDPFNSDTLYVGTAFGGVWKSINNGVDWSPITDFQSILQTSAIEMDPDTAGTLYVGSGDYHGSSGAAGAVSGGDGIWKSVDSGATWLDGVRVASKEKFGTAAVSDIEVLPGTNVVLATTGRGGGNTGNAWISTNGGNSWAKCKRSGGEDLPAGNWSSISISGAQPGTGKRSIWMVGNAGILPLVYVSEDGGTSFAQITGLPNLPNGGGALMVAASNLVWDDGYILYSTGISNVLKLNHNGAGFTLIGNNLPEGDEVVADYNFSQNTYDYSFALRTWVDEFAISHESLYVGQIDIAYSEGATDSWVSIGGPTYSANAWTHNDQHAVAVDPNNPNRLMVCNDGGVYMLNHPPGGTPLWTSLNVTLGNTQFYRIATHPDKDWLVMGGTQDNGSPRSQLDGTNADAFNNWSSALPGGDGGFTFYDHKFASTTYVSNNNLRVWRSNNNGVNYGDITPTTFDSEGDPIYWNGQATAFIAPFVIDPNDRTFVYGGTSRLWRYNAGSNTWSQLAADFSGVGNNEVVTSIAVAKGDSKVIYVGTSRGKLYYTENSGTNFFDISGDLPFGYITAISPDPLNKFRVLVAQGPYGQQNLRISNIKAAGGVTWALVTGPAGNANLSLHPVTINDVERDPDLPSTIWYVSQDDGLFMTKNAGGTWENLGDPYGLPKVHVNDIEFNVKNRYLHVGTFGRGMWRLPVPTRSLLVTLNPSTVTGGQGSVGTVTLPEPAPVGGWTFLLTSSSSLATVPPTISFAEGETTKSFNIATSKSPGATVTIKAASENMQGSAVLTIGKTWFNSLVFTSNEVWGGTEHVIATLTLWDYAPAGGFTANLASSDTSVATVPASITFAQGAYQKAFIITTKVVNAPKSVTITASRTGESISQTLLVKPNRPSALAITATEAWGGTEHPILTVSLDANAPPANQVVTMASSDVNFATVPATTTVPYGNYQANIQITTKVVAVTKLVTFTATCNGGSKTVGLTVKPNRPSALAFTHTEVFGGVENATATVSLDATAPPANQVVTLFSNDTASATVPATTTVQSGNYQANFIVTSKKVVAPKTVTISATCNGGTKSNTILIKPNRPTALAITAPDAWGGTEHPILTVSLQSSMGASGQVVNMNSSDTSAATVPSTATVASGTYQANIPITTNLVTTNKTVTFTASCNGGSATVNLLVKQIYINSLALSADPVVGGTHNPTLTTSLIANAPPGGINVTYTSSHPNVASVPASSLISDGAYQGNVEVTTFQVATDTTVTLTVKANASTKTIKLKVTSPGLDSISVDPNPVKGGYPATGTIAMLNNAPAGGTTISLSSNSSVLVVPATVKIAEGTHTITFPVTTLPVAAQTTRRITATLGITTRFVDVTLLPGALVSVSVSPNPIFGGNNGTGTVKLSGPSAQDETVGLASNSSILVVPGQVVVPSGASQANFTVTTPVVSTTATRQITATLDHITKAVSVTVQSGGLMSLSVTPNNLIGGDPTTGKVTLSGPAPTGGRVVTLSSTTSFIVPPASVTVPAGATTATFPITTQATTATFTRQVRAALGSILKIADVTLNPRPLALSSLTMNPASVKGGTSSTGTVTLTTAAPAGGISVALSTNTSSIQVPPSISIASASSKTFTATTSAVTATATRTVSASYNGVTKTASLTLTP